MDQNLTEWMGGHLWAWALSLALLAAAGVLVARGARR